MSAIEDVRKADDARLAALLSHDIPALQGIVHPDIMYTHANGQLDNWEQYFAPLIAGTIRYKAAQRDDIRIKFYGDTALLTGKVAQTVCLSGVDTDFLIRYSITWTKREGKWQMIMWHASKVA